MRTRGFTLVELMIGLALLALLLLMAMPTMIEYRGNSRIRNITDSIAQGLRQAQVEALKRNRDIQFILVPGTGWQLLDPHPDVGGNVETEPFADGGFTTATALPPGATMVVYSGLGVYRALGTPDAPPAPGPIQRINVTAPTMTNPHNLQIVIDPTMGVGVRVCDPQFLSTDPDPVKASIGCPP